MNRPHPVVGVMAMQRVTQRGLATATGYTAHHVEKVVNKRYPACPKFRRAVAAYFGVPESFLFDAEACS